MAATMEPKQYPKAVEGLVHSPLDGGSAVYQASADRVHYLNHTGAVIMELCNGLHSVEEIVEFLQVSFALREPPDAEVRDLLENMTAMGLVSWLTSPLDGQAPEE